MHDDYSTVAAAPGTGREEEHAPGLSMPHISPQGEIKFWLGGSLVQACKPELQNNPPVGGGKRGKAQFSFASRLRLMQRLSKVRRAEVPLFLTLTYPGEYSQDHERWKRDIDTLWKRAKRKFPDMGWIWKIEPQKRGAPHYHVLVWGAEYAHLLLWVKQAWYEVVGSGDEKHLRAGTRVERLRSFKGAKCYASKYLGKVIESHPDLWAEGVGRWWGVRGDECIPWADLVRVSASYTEVARFMRLIRRYAGIRSREYRSLYGMVNDADYWFDRVDRLVMEGP